MDKESLKVLLGKVYDQIITKEQGVHLYRSQMKDNTGDIAVIGISGRFPEADNIEEFWDHLINNRSCITKRSQKNWISGDEIDGDLLYGGFLKNVLQFDPLFFQITPKEAETMDPQERLFLQVCWETLEDAGYTRNSLQKEQVGVFVGATWPEYSFYSNIMCAESEAVISTNLSNISNRVSYFLNFKGTSMTVDTACSSSFSALHFACESLNNGKDTVALVGGVNLSLHLNKYKALEKYSFLSEKGHCDSFGNEGDGYVPGECVAAVMLKPLHQAEADGDHIYGVIKSVAINHSGKTNGYAVPDPDSQTEVIQKAIMEAQVNPADISYIEAHGTGTPLGDPIEIEGLCKAFVVANQKKQYCCIGSVKSIIGHCESAAGIVGLIKTLLQFKYKKLIPIIHPGSTNDDIDFEQTPFFVASQVMDWISEDETGRHKRIAGISSFGAGGTNVHTIVSEYEKQEKDTKIEESNGQLILLSARAKEQLYESVTRLHRFLALSRAEDINLEGMAYTLQLGREHMKWRVGFIAQSVHELENYLQMFLLGSDDTHYRSGIVSQVSVELDCLEAKVADPQIILEQWINGSNIRWGGLYENQVVQKVSLPTYPFEKDSYLFPQKETDKESTLLIYPKWQDEVVKVQIEVGYDRHIMLVYDELPETKQVITKNKQFKDPVWAHLYQNYALHLFKVIQKAMEEKRTGHILIQVIVPEEKRLSGLYGLLQTASKENPKIIGQLIEVNSELWREKSEVIINENKHIFQNCRVSYQNGKRYVLSWQPAQNVRMKNRCPWQDEGVYIISGGLGGLGYIIASDIVDKVSRTTIIMLANSVLTEEKSKKIKQLEETGAKVIYKQVDVTDATALDECIKQISTKYKKIHGVLHCAGINRDNYLKRKTLEEFVSVLKPKVQGTEYLDFATRQMDLEFFVLFSSGAAITGNLGQADYATANAFMDDYSIWRNVAVRKGERFGKTVSINWPLWKSGGMNVDDETEKIMEKISGMKPLHSQKGIHILYHSLNSDDEQVAPLYGDMKKLLPFFRGELMKPQPACLPKKENATNIMTKIFDQLLHIFSNETKISHEKLDLDEGLENYGIDSVLITKLNMRLEEIVSGVSKTIFYECQNLREVAEHLALEYKEGDEEWSCVNPSEQENIIDIAVEQEDEAIAIIGISARLPQAENWVEFWENLQYGTDCISKIPDDRWEMEDFYVDEIEKAISTGRSYSNRGGMLDHIYEFDSLFFNLSPVEAAIIDPQERLFLQSCWAVLEDGGYTKEQIKKQFGNNVGVFAGITKSGYELFYSDYLNNEHSIYPTTSFASAANRVSYFMNFNGPSMAIDTMCSSSLVAVHEACEHIRRGECRMAIAGGVNLYTHPITYKKLSAMKMISPQGKCCSFGEDADGYVPGEGVGAILLKQLSQAIEDGDHIYGVLRGSAVNHDGKTNGYTVPNPNAQCDVIQKAMKRAQITPDQMNLIEAHGTGTKLGDPIEITGLIKALGMRNKEENPCYISSVKSNIGHLEAAAGIAGLIKVVLQMKHKKLVPNLHSTIINTNINFEKSPLELVQNLKDWESFGKKRIAGVSSFGAGGTNAHVIIEEFEQDKVSSECKGKEIIVLSAKTKESLLCIVERTLAYIERFEFKDCDLSSIAYTLQTGREAMKERISFVVSDIEDLKEKLRNCQKEEVADDRIFKGTVLQREAKARVQMDQDDETVARLWTEGADIIWPDKKRNIISLPTYAFVARECRLPQNKEKQVHLYPLLHEKVKEGEEYIYRTTFSGDEPLLSEHLIQGNKVLAGTAYVEMAYSAAVLSYKVNEHEYISLEDIAWLRVYQVGGTEKSLSISLENNENSKKRFLIYSEKERGKVLYCEGYIQIKRKEKEVPCFSESIDVNKGQRIISKQEFYQHYDNMGICYGKTFRTLVTVQFSEKIAYAELNAELEVNNYNLTPGLIDGALQATMVLGESAEKNYTYLPYAIEEIKIYKEPSQKLSVIIEKDSDSNPVVGEQKFNLSLFDVNKDLCMVIRGFSMRKKGGVLKPATEPLTYILPVWTKVDIKEEEINRESVYSPSLIGKSIDEMYEDILAADKITNINWLSQNRPDTVENLDELIVTQETGVIQLFRLMKALLQAGYGSRELDWKIVIFGVCDFLNGKRPNISDSSIMGLIGSIAKEYTNWHFRFVDYLSDEESKTINFKSIPISKTGDLLVYRNKEYYELKLEQVGLWKGEKHVLRRQGVYIIIGGAGGIGYELSKYLIMTYAAKVVWVGRRDEDDYIREKIDKLYEFGERPIYIKGDASDKTSLERCRFVVKSMYGQIHGVVHSALILADKSLMNMNESIFKAGLLAKVDISIRIAQVFGQEELDFLLFFSSMQSFSKEPGQCNYASGCTFKDNFAKYLNSITDCRTRVINWGYWGSIGIVASDDYRKRMERRGIGSIEPEEAMLAVERILNGDQVQLGVMKLIPAKEKDDRESLVKTIASNSLMSRLKEKIQKNKGADNKSSLYTTKVLSGISEILDIPMDVIDRYTELEEYGMDYIKKMELFQYLSVQTKEEIMASNLFSCHTAEDIIQFFNNLDKKRGKNG